MTGRKFVFLEEGVAQFTYEYKGKDSRPTVVECLAFYCGNPLFQVGEDVQYMTSKEGYGDYGSYEISDGDYFEITNYGVDK